jgi:hypothetical protein
MIQHIDAALRDLLKSLLPQTEYDISFEAPALAWSSGRSGSTPALNVYLYDIIENRGLQRNDWEIRRNADRTVTEVRPPAMLDLYYLVSVWRFDDEDAGLAEHELLGGVVRRFLALHRLPDQFLPEELASDLPDSQSQISLHMELSPSLSGAGAGLVWRSFGQGLRPSMPLRVTVPMDLRHQMTDAMIVTRTIRYPELGEERIRVSGTVETSGKEPQPVVAADVSLFDAAGSFVARTVTDDDGRFTFMGLQRGGYTVDVRAEGFTGKRVKIERLELAERGDLTVHLNRRGG